MSLMKMSTQLISTIISAAINFHMWFVCDAILSIVNNLLVASRAKSC